MAKKSKEESDEKAVDLKGSSFRVMSSDTSFYKWKVPFSHVGLQKITGGLIGGGFMGIEGMSYSGKSYLLYELLASCVNMGGYALLVDAEQAYDPSFGAKIGLEQKKNSRFFYSEERVIETIFPDIIALVKQIRTTICKDLTKPIVIGIDSVTPLRSKEQTENDEKGKQTGYGAMKKNNALYDQCNVIQPLLREYQASIVFLSQVRKDTNAGLFQDPTKVNAENLIYFYNQRLRGKTLNAPTRESKTQEDSKIKIGFKTSWEVLKNRFLPPFRKVTAECYFDKGLAKYSGFFDLLVTEELIKKGKAKDPKDARKKIDVVKVMSNNKVYPVQGGLNRMIKENPHLIDPNYVVESGYVDFNEMNEDLSEMPDSDEV